ncbi:MAG: thioredoxin family protein [Tannerella sp.]|jgi:glutaredoxin|nr:thioredoxin family protein [Tannerella sp.]
MKSVKLFYLKSCPYCHKALSYIDELKKQDAFKNLEIEMIEESEEPDVADQYDYFYVPTCYVDGIKVHEGAATFEEIEAVFRKAIE